MNRANPGEMKTAPRDSLGAVTGWRLRDAYPVTTVHIRAA
jgi:hypothetical protein